MDVVQRIQRRFFTEVLDLDPIADPPAPRADWPTWSNTADCRLRVLSLNAWGLPVAPHCTERAVEIANAIDDSFDIVVLQEIWHRRERNIIIWGAQKAGFEYYHYFQAATGFPIPFGADSFGTGLLVLSKYPIVSSMYYSFSLSGRPYALHEADYIANKGAGHLRVQTPVGEIDLYVTHLIANYNHLGKPGPGDRYLPHRVAQAYELVRLISNTARNDLVLVCGDFNSPSDCTVLRLPRHLLQIRDAFTDKNNHDGLTFATEDNKFSHGEHPMRMDYILYKVAQPSSSEPGWQLQSSDVFKKFFVDERGVEHPISDHFGVVAEFVFGKRAELLKPCQQALGETSKESQSPVSNPSRLRTCATTTCIHCDEAKAKTGDLDISDYSARTRIHCLEEVEQAITAGRADAVERRAGHLRRSGVSLMLVFVLAALRLSSVLGVSWLIIFPVLSHCLLEYYLAFFVVTLECSNFTELMNQVRLHLNAEQVRQARIAST
ncbi:hypothetical protein P43SY_009149 [Pythium insidiosum]|uniref:Endonuclease/exonuclease/phosphatase domain-containing protein n=1 Tax=Pythium insidiosum TaxID=114742 RepID=A0AAD5Q7G2_PYTIN|nr:hypothetical protein P43SY_009149 [Pythium insidiosum]